MNDGSLRGTGGAPKVARPLRGWERWLRRERRLWGRWTPQGWWRRTPRAATALWLASLGLFTAASFTPGFRAPGYESALLAGLAMAPSLAVAMSLSGSLGAARRNGHLALRWALGSFAFVVVVLTLQGARAGFCNAGEGYARLVLGPGFGFPLAALWGAVVATAVRGTGKRVALALALPVAGAALSLGRFYFTPMVFAFDPLFGFFAGPLYDTVIGRWDALWTYRLASAAWLVALLLGLPAASARWRRWRGPRRRGPARLAAVVAAGLALASAVAGARWDHWHTSASIAEGLGADLSVGRCRVTYSVAAGEPRARLLAAECNAHLEELSSFFSVQAPQVRVFLFATGDERQRFTGASGTSIAKPWRREVYVVVDGFPHALLRHELAHVVAGVAAPGPFHVGGRWGGARPSPLLIEGAAVAAAPQPRQGLTLEERARTLLELGQLPSLEQLNGLGFFWSSGPVAYDAAGAFLAWFRREAGPAALSRWYGGAPLEAVTGQTLAAWESRWRQALERQRLPAGAVDEARARFEQPAVLLRRCPREVDERFQVAAALQNQGQWSAAAEGFGSLAQWEPAHLGASLRRLECEWQGGHERDGALEALAQQPQRSAPERSAILERRGDWAWVEGRRGAAAEAYAAAQQLSLDADRRRNLAVKRWAAQTTEPGATLLRTLLAGRRASQRAALPQRGDEPTEAALWLEFAAWARQEPAAGLPAYLVGRQLLLGAGDPSGALRWLDEAAAAVPVVPELGPELQRLRFFAACQLGEPAVAAAAAGRFLQLAEGQRTLAGAAEEVRQARGWCAAVAPWVQGQAHSRP